LTFSVLLANFVANIGYALADPRIRFRSQELR
jgi:ABC-type dipeptide/oligopeptide/nickel transport system permease component